MASYVNDLDPIDRIDRSLDQLKFIQGCISNGHALDLIGSEAGLASLLEDIRESIDAAAHEMLESQES